MNEIGACLESIPSQEIQLQEDEDKDLICPSSRSRSSSLSLSQIVEILGSLLVKIIGTEERLEESSHRVYLVYKFYIYSPISSWTFFKRYNDFIELQKQVREVLGSHSEYSTFVNYKFPEKHWYWTRDTVITMRTESFQKYVEKSLKIPVIVSLISHFIGFDEHIHEFSTSTMTPKIKPTLFDSESEHEETSTSTGYNYKNEFTSTFATTHLKQSSPSPASLNLFTEQQFQHMSELLDNMTGPCLFSSLPLSGQTERYQLAYATYRDGWNMQTLYNKVGLKYPLILIIRVLGYRGIFGAYIPCPLGPPSFEFKGNGDCYIFKIYNDHIDKYPTRVSTPENIEYLKKAHHHPDSESHSRTSSTNTNVHEIERTTSQEDQGPFSLFSLLSSFSFHSRNSEDQSKARRDEHSNSPSHKIENEQIPADLSHQNTGTENKSDKNDESEEFNSTLYEFFYSNMDVIIFGGSQKLGTNAIRLSNDLSTFSSGPSDTYGNPSLISQNHENVGSMTVSDIEVFTALGCC